MPMVSTTVDRLSILFFCGLDSFKKSLRDVSVKISDINIYM